MQGERADPAVFLPNPSAVGTAHGESPFSYAAEFVSLAIALIVGRLFYPALVEERGCVLLKDRFSRPHFEDWWDNLGGDVPAIEAAINHVHLWDLIADEPTANNERAYLEIADVIAENWRQALRTAFPDRQFEVQVSSGPDEYGPSVTFRST